MATTKKAKCPEPAAAAARLGNGEEAPVCEKHLYALRAKANKAGKQSLPKGATKAQVATIVGTNRDDVLPIHVRALSTFEKDGEIGCYFHLIDTGEK